jgi:hypothetical protein
MDRRRTGKMLIIGGIAMVLAVYLGCGISYSLELPLDLDKGILDKKMQFTLAKNKRICKIKQ